MKKKYIYMLVPLCGVILFSLFYIPFAKHYDDLQAQKHQEEIKAKNAKAEAEAEARRQAILDATASAERHKREREAKLAREKAQQDALDAAVADRQKAHNDKQKYSDEVDKLQKEIKAEKQAIAELERNKQDALKEQAFLKSYVQQAEINRKNILSLLDKLDAADKARAAAEAAKKANNS